MTDIKTLKHGEDPIHFTCSILRQLLYQNDDHLKQSTCTALLVLYKIKTTFYWPWLILHQVPLLQGHPVNYCTSISKMQNGILCGQREEFMICVKGWHHSQGDLRFKCQCLLTKKQEQNKTREQRKLVKQTNQNPSFGYQVNVTELSPSV